MIYLLSSELTALEEISKLCGDKKIKGKGKDKPDETRPLISVTDLQKLQFKDAIIIKQRQSPFQTKLKGVDEYSWNIPKFDKAEYPSREKQPINLFDMKEYVKEHRKDSIGNMFGPKPGDMGNPFVDMPPYSPPRPNSNVPNIPGGSKPDENFEVDELIKKIDEKIAELEAEEKAEKTKGSSTKPKYEEEFIPFMNDLPIKEEPVVKMPEYSNDNLKKIVEPDLKDAVKVDQNIEEIINKIDDDNTSDDQFFDDFFADE